MFKRVLIVLLTALLLSSAALAEADVPQALPLLPESLYLLVSRDTQGVDTPVGSAVVYQNQSTLLTTAWTLLQLDGELYALGAGDEIEITGSAMLSDRDGLVTLTLASPSPAAPLSPNPVGTAVYALGHTLQEQAVCHPIQYPSAIPYGESAAMLYSVPGAMLPGSVLLDEQGLLCGISLAAYGEGVNRYVALPLSESTLAADTISWLTGFTVTADAGYLHVDWSACDMTCDKDDCVTGVFYADTRNPYYSYFMEEETSVEILMVPGHNYQVWVQHAHGDIDTDAARPEEASVLATIPEAEAFERYNYKDSSIYLAAVPLEDAEECINMHIPPMEAMTAEALADAESAIFMQVVSSYTVAADVEADLLVVLTTPEGYTFDLPGTFLFDTTLQEKDEWNVEIYPLLDDYLSFNESGEFVPGEYTLCYYLDGALANQLTWVLK